MGKDATFLIEIIYYLVNHKWLIHLKVKDVTMRC